jgi:hypothetical protein
MAFLDEAIASLGARLKAESRQLRARLARVRLRAES